jgi:vacuolar-type H+-ATPase subunit I/STV1
MEMNERVYDEHFRFIKEDDTELTYEEHKSRKVTPCEMASLEQFNIDKECPKSICDYEREIATLKDKVDELEKCEKMQKLGYSLETNKLKREINTLKSEKEELQSLSIKQSHMIMILTHQMALKDINIQELKVKIDELSKKED